MTTMKQAMDAELSEAIASLNRANDLLMKMFNTDTEADDNA